MRYLRFGADSAEDLHSRCVSRWEVEAATCPKRIYDRQKSALAEFRHRGRPFGETRESMLRSFRFRSRWEIVASMPFLPRGKHVGDKNNNFRWPPSSPKEGCQTRRLRWEFNTTPVPEYSSDSNCFCCYKFSRRWNWCNNKRKLLQDLRLFAVGRRRNIIYILYLFLNI